MPSTTVQVLITQASDFTTTPLRVELTVRGQSGAVVVGRATPDESGRCALTYDPEVARDLAAEKPPRVRLRVLAGVAPLPIRGGPTVWPLDDAPQTVEVTVGADDAPASVAVPGTVSAEADGAPLSGLTVTATLTAEPQRSHTLASLVTDEHGAFLVAYDPATFPAWALQGAAISLRVMRDGTAMPIVDGPRRWAVGEEPGDAAIVVDVAISQPGGEDGEPTVSGTIRHTDGSLIAGVRVEAVQLSVIGEQILAEATTGPDGAYRFPHDPAVPPPVFVRVVGEDGRVVAASPPVDGATSPRADVYVRDERLRGAWRFDSQHPRGIHIGLDLPRWPSRDE